MSDAWSPPYIVTVPVDDTDRDLGQTEIQKWTTVSDFITKSSDVIDELLITPTAGTGVGAGTLFIASPTAPKVQRDKADLVLSSTAGVDHAIAINGAIQNITENTYTTYVGGTQTNKQFGSVTLSDGVFNLNTPILVPSRGFHLRGTSLGTVLRNGTTQNGFATTGANVNASGDKGMIMVKDSLPGLNSAKTIIEDLFIICGTYLPDNQVSGILIGLDDKPASVQTSPQLYGYPIPTNAPDQNWIIRNVHVINCEYGIRWEDTDGGRDVWIKDCWVGGCAKGGIWAAGSDCMISGSQAISSANSVGCIGFMLNSGNGKISHCKASYIGSPTQAGVGYTAGSGRVTFTACESQDCTTGFDGGGSDDLIFVSCRADTQELSANAGGVGFDLAGCNRLSMSGCIVHTRPKQISAGPPPVYVDGTFLYGIVLPGNGEYANVHATVGKVGITNQVGKNVSGTRSAVALTTGVPTNVVASIVRDTTTPLLSSGAP